VPVLAQEGDLALAVQEGLDVDQGSVQVVWVVWVVVVEGQLSCLPCGCRYYPVYWLETNRHF